jgi:hypothetical protein
MMMEYLQQQQQQRQQQCYETALATWVAPRAAMVPSAVPATMLVLQR